MAWFLEMEVVSSISRRRKRRKAFPLAWWWPQSCGTSWPVVCLSSPLYPPADVAILILQGSQFFFFLLYFLPVTASTFACLHSLPQSYAFQHFTRNGGNFPNISLVGSFSSGFSHYTFTVREHWCRQSFANSSNNKFNCIKQLSPLPFVIKHLKPLNTLSKDIDTPSAINS